MESRNGVGKIKEEPGDEPEDVIFNSHYGVRTIELNRPRKLNSLNASMARKIVPRLLEWRKSDLANIILITGAGPKAFCAGGDVAALAQQNTEGRGGQMKSHEYFKLEYQLDHLIATYTKPYIAYMDGITMGGGVGLSVHAPIRIATERTVFSMPETTIGFFNDVGGSFFLPRLEGSIGTYLALTSKRLDGLEAFFAGVATHYIHSSSLSDLTARLAELQFKDYDSLQTRLDIINATIAEYDTGLPNMDKIMNLQNGDSHILMTGEIRKAIDRCFRHDSIEAILESLEEENQEYRNRAAGSVGLWADETLNTLSERSPTSLRVALRLMRMGKEWTIAETFQREYELAGRFMAHPDFTEGVSARLIRKPPTTPVWNPPVLEAVSDSSIEDMLQPQEGERKLELSHTGMNYKDYPYSFVLPREEEVEKLVRTDSRTKEATVNHLLGKYSFRSGVKEKVEDILERCCDKGKNGSLVWVGN